jgi:hypothetical protein
MDSLEVLTEIRYREACDLIPGDLVMGMDGKAHPIEAIQLSKDSYRVVLDDTSSVILSSNHKVALKSYVKPLVEVMQWDEASYEIASHNSPEYRRKAFDNDGEVDVFDYTLMNLPNILYNSVRKRWLYFQEMLAAGGRKVDKDTTVVTLFREQTAYDFAQLGRSLGYGVEPRFVWKGARYWNCIVKPTRSIVSITPVDVPTYDLRCGSYITREYIPLVGQDA